MARRCLRTGKLLALKPAARVPGHGSVMRDDNCVRKMFELLKFIDSQTRRAFARCQSAVLEEIGKVFAGESILRGLLFNRYVVGLGVNRAYLQVSGKL